MFRVVGDFKNLKSPELDLELFKSRDIFLDCREPIVLEQNVSLGFNVTILSQSHDKNNRDTVTKRPVIIRKDAFIGSNSILYNCEIGEGSWVACGTVVRSRKVPPYCVVEGNPARIVKKKVDGKWVSCELPLELRRGSHTGET